MTPRRRAILIVALALLLIGLIVAVVLWLMRANDDEPFVPAPDEETTQETTPAQIEDPAPENPLKPVAAEAPPAGSTAAAQMAELFAERYGSYSNQGDFQNLRDLLPVMTAAYRAKTEAYLETASPVPGATYEGVTSVKISTQVRAYDEGAGTATIAVNLQQQKRAGSSNAAVAYRSLKMGLKRSGQDWKVDSAVWEN